MCETNMGVVFLGRNRDFATELCGGIGSKRILPLATVSNLKTLEPTLKCLQPEVIAIDDSFSETTAARVLQRVNSFDFYATPIVIVISHKNDARYIEMCMEYGAAYYMLKPVVAEIFWERAQMLFDYQYEKTIENSIRVRKGGKLSREEVVSRDVMELLYFVGCSPKLKGFVYLKEAIMLEVNEPYKNFNGRSLYHVIGNKFHQSWSNIERNVGVAVKSINTVATMEYFNKICDNIICNTNTITSLEFISLAAHVVSQRLRQKQGG